MKITRFHIGTQKAGSTYLYNLFSSHSGVNLGRVTEINYFSKNYEKGGNWYRGKFKGNGDFIDTSPKYFMQGEEVAPRMKEYERSLGGEKIQMMLILRNPVDYLYSHFQMHLKHNFFKTHPGKFPKLSTDIMEFTKMYPEYLERGFYFKLLHQYWLKYFDIQQFKIVFFEEFVSNTQVVLKGILDFWGLKNIPLDAKGVSKNKKLKFNILFKVQKKIIKNEKLKRKLKQSRIFNYIYNKFLTEDTKEKIFKEQREYLKEIYNEDVGKLKKLLDNKINGWEDFL